MLDGQGEEVEDAGGQREDHQEALDHIAMKNLTLHWSLAQESGTFSTTSWLILILNVAGAWAQPISEVNASPTRILSMANYKDTIKKIPSENKRRKC